MYEPLSVKMKQAKWFLTSSFIDHEKNQGSKWNYIRYNIVQFWAIRVFSACWIYNRKGKKRFAHSGHSSFSIDLAKRLWDIRMEVFPMMSHRANEALYVFLIVFGLRVISFFILFNIFIFVYCLFFYRIVSMRASLFLRRCGIISVPVGVFGSFVLKLHGALDNAYLRPNID